MYGRSTNGTLTHWYWNTDMGAPDIENWGR
ncbi:hypothetical protein [Amycolatopsis sp. NPDC049159]